jgi:hypothetical protein
VLRGLADADAGLAQKVIGANTVRRLQRGRPGPEPITYLEPASFGDAVPTGRERLGCLIFLVELVVACDAGPVAAGGW